MAYRIKLYAKDANPSIDNPAYHIDKLKASKLLRSGKAVMIGKHCLQLTKLGKEKIPHEYGAYELVAITAKSCILNAGRMNGERQPAEIDPFKSCRIGH